MIVSLHLVQKFNIKSFAVSYGMTFTVQSVISIMPFAEKRSPLNFLVLSKEREDSLYHYLLGTVL